MIVYKENKDTISPIKYENIICFDNTEIRELFVVSVSVVSKSETSTKYIIWKIIRRDKLLYLLIPFKSYLWIRVSSYPSIE